MSEIIFRKAGARDRDALIAMRLMQLREEGAEPVYDLRPYLEAYYREHMENGSFVSWIAAQGNIVVGTSGISIVEKPPYYANPNGKIGLLSGMFTLPSFRRRGIAKALLGKVVGEAKARGCAVVQLTASEAGALLYANFGFQKKNNFMQYDIP